MSTNTQITPQNLVQPFFSTPIYATRLESPEIQDEITAAIGNVNFVTAPAEWGSTHKISACDGASLFGEDVIAQLNLTKLKAAIEEHIRVFMLISGHNNVEIDTVISWFTLNERGSYGRSHTHGDAHISGVYYYQTSGNDGDIYFMSPALVQTTNRYFAGYANDIRFPPVVGGLLMFPGWLQHGVQTNMTDSKRISLSFNVYLKEGNRKHDMAVPA